MELQKKLNVFSRVKQRAPYTKVRSQRKARSVKMGEQDGVLDLNTDTESDLLKSD